MRGSSIRSILYVGIALGMLFYAVPRLSIGQGWTWPTLFSVAWILFALFVIAAHLHAILRVDAAAERKLRLVRMARRRQLAQVIERRIFRKGSVR
jgi:hypothetical protein